MGMKDASHTMSVGGCEISSSVTFRALVRSNTTTRSSVRSGRASWPYPTSIANTLAAPAFRMTSVKPPVEHPTSTATAPSTLRENASSACAIFIPPRDTQGCSFCPLRRSGLFESIFSAALVMGTSAASTFPAMHSAAASLASAARPSATSSSSTRTFVILGLPPPPIATARGLRAPCRVQEEGGGGRRLWLRARSGQSGGGCEKEAR
mmetsp:Transcript_13280/g.32470  ORF Transcript_13280/g.32470 Transcript_13280/m.32470 type:complete len:208 (-) Transcript_13280:543-1166(-)